MSPARIILIRPNYSSLCGCQQPSRNVIRLTARGRNAEFGKAPVASSAMTFLVGPHLGQWPVKRISIPLVDRIGACLAA
jgi:hypothetical protein